MKVLPGCSSVNTLIRTRLRKIREEKGLTLWKVASSAGMPLSSYACTEGGHYRIHLDHLHRILQVLEADINEVWPAENEISG